MRCHLQSLVIGFLKQAIVVGGQPSFSLRRVYRVLAVTGTVDSDRYTIWVKRCMVWNFTTQEVSLVFNGRQLYAVEEVHQLDTLLHSDMMVGVCILWSMEVFWRILW